MGDLAKGIFIAVLLLSPIALIAVSILWLKAKARANAAELAIESRLSEMRAEADRLVAQANARLDGLSDLDAEKARVGEQIAAANAEYEDLEQFEVARIHEF